MNEDEKRKIEASVLLREAIQGNDSNKRAEAILALREFYPNMEEGELVRNALAFLASELREG